MQEISPSPNHPAVVEENFLVKAFEKSTLVKIVCSLHSQNICLTPPPFMKTAGLYYYFVDLFEDD